MQPSQSHVFGNLSPHDEFTRLLSAQRADALLMLDYARQKGLDVSEHLIIDLLVEPHPQHNEVGGPAYAKFIDALANLTKIVAPATPGSIRFSAEVDKKGRNRIRSLVFKYASIGYFIFVSLLLFQGYWFLLNGVIESINKTVIALVPYGELEAAMPYLLAEKNHRKPTDNEVTDELERYYDQFGKEVMQSGSKTDVGNLGGNVQVKDEKYMTDAERSYLRLTLASDLAALNRFVGVFSRWFIDPKIKPGDADLYYVWTVGHVDIRNIQAAHMVLDMLSRYVLPIIYGLLGSSLYLVRRLNGEIKAVSFAESSRAELGSRFFLGGVSGLVIAWFVTPESSTLNLLGYSPDLISRLSPLALSFIAGYAIELLFSMIDKVVGAFTEKTTK